MSLNVRWGSGTMRQILESGLRFREFGRGIFPGLRRAWELICCFVERISHIGSRSTGDGDKELEAARIFFLLELESAGVVGLWM